MNRKRSKPKSDHTMPMVHPNAAAIDIGATMHMAAVRADRTPEPVRSFGTFTTDLHRLVDWFTECGVETVVMESTSVYWIPIFELLDARGFAVFVVNARDAKHVPGRKTDVSDAQWLQRLHSYGLLRASFRPKGQIAELRAYVRQRERLLEYAASHIQHMQKALTEMNLQLHHVVADVTGATGLRIIRAILAGERDPKVLARLRDYRCHAGAETIENALTGNYRAEHLFALEHLLTTGGSVKDFVRALAGDGIRVSSVVALAGDRRLQIDEKTCLALKTALQEKGIELQTSKLLGNLTRSEARGIVLLINNLRTENGKAKLTQNLQRVLDRRALEHMGGDKKPERHFGPEREDPRHEPDDKRIQARDILENRQRADLSREEFQRPQIRVLPDDLASLKAIWQVELERFLVPIKAKAARVEEKLTAMLVRHDERMGKHEKAKPKALPGPLARLSQGKHNKRIAAWDYVQDSLYRRGDQLRQRLNLVQEYARAPISEFYLSRAQQYAGNQLAKEQPELARKLEQAREHELRQRYEQVTMEFEKREHTQDQRQHRGRYR